ncbi:MAG: hypothetical protein R3C45_08310 [Phycisphaerales bacterium]
MPVYHFTYHAYGTWLPDKPRGYTRHKTGIHPPDPRMAQRYRDNMAEPPASFPRTVQRALIDELITACDRQSYQPHAAATDKTHLHVIVAWKTTRAWRRVRAGLQHSLSRRLNQGFGKRTWFVAHPSRKRVKDKGHYDYLIQRYLPDHRGWKWDYQRGLYL